MAQSKGLTRERTHTASTYKFNRFRSHVLGNGAGDGPEVGGGVRVVLVRGAGFLREGSMVDMNGHGGIVDVAMDVLDFVQMCV